MMESLSGLWLQGGGEVEVECNKVLTEETKITYEVQVGTKDVQWAK